MFSKPRIKYLKMYKHKHGFCIQVRKKLIGQKSFIFRIFYFYSCSFIWKKVGLIQRLDHFARGKLLFMYQTRQTNWLKIRAVWITVVSSWYGFSRDNTTCNIHVDIPTKWNVINLVWEGVLQVFILFLYKEKFLNLNPVLAVMPPHSSLSLPGWH